MKSWRPLKDFVKKHGLKHALTEFGSRLHPRRIFSDYIYWYIYEPFIDWRMGVYTRGYIDEEYLELPTENHNPYMAVCPHDFNTAMKHVSIQPDMDVFMDYGSGLGRALILATRYPFKQIIGVEISEKLNKWARENLEETNVKPLCSNVSIIAADAAAYEVPFDVTVIHIYNLAKGELLIKIFNKIHQSLLKTPRTITLLFTHPDNFEPMADQFPWAQPIIKSPCWNASKCTIYTCSIPTTDPSLKLDDIAKI